MIFEPPSSAESLRVVFVDRRQVWNVQKVEVGDKGWVQFRAGGTLYRAPVSSIVAIETHTAAGEAKLGLHDGRHGRECIVCAVYLQWQPENET